jgi:DNA polymerase-3 subunit beta
MTLALSAPISLLGPVLKRAEGVADKAAKNPILGCVLLSADHDGVLTVSAKGGSLTLIQRVALGTAGADGVTDTGGVAVDAARLATVIGGLPGDSVLLRVTGKTGRGVLEVKAGGSRYSLSAADAADYPPLSGEMPEVARAVPDAVTVIKGGDLARMLKETVFSVCSDENRYGLNGLLIEAVEVKAGEPSRIRVVSTDGSRLSWSEGVASAPVTLAKRKSLISRPFAAKLASLISGTEQEWTLTIGQRWITARCGDVELGGVLVEGEFPDYRMIMPASPKRIATVNGPALSSALRRASLMASDRNSSVRIEFGPEGLVVSAQDVKAGSVTEQVPCELEGPSLSTGFNARYLLEVLGATRADSVRLELGEALDPVIIRVDGRAEAVFVVMPMRLD